MNEETKAKIENLARNLKNMHLAATIEEARKRAEEIILSTAKEGEKSIKELMENSQMPSKDLEEAETAEDNSKNKEEE